MPEPCLIVILWPTEHSSMCSVTLWTRSRGYLLGMNRDESRTRISALPPEKESAHQRQVISPREPEGGTWISMNDFGVSFALVNWYSQSRLASVPIVSRGKIVRTLRSAIHPNEARSLLAQFDLNHLNSFRLVGVFPETETVLEWQWGGKELLQVEHRWAPAQWISSGWDEPGAQRARSAVFESFREDSDAGTSPWLRKLHGSHCDGPGPYSTCMHREDAATVSYTEIEVDTTGGELRYLSGPLCESHEWYCDRLLKPGGSNSVFPRENKPIGNSGNQRGLTAATEIGSSHRHSPEVSTSHRF